MSKNIQIGNEIFNELSMIKNGLGVSWTTYLTMLSENTTIKYRLEKENKELRDLLEIARKAK